LLGVALLGLTDAMPVIEAQAPEEAKPVKESE
jgi:hypothetical protein